MYLCSMYSKELLKGTISVIILKLLSEHKRMYGYQITRKVIELTDNKIQFKEGSLYPSLHRLKEEGMVEVETVNIGKRVRRYYTLTDKGISEMKEKIAETMDFINTVKKLLS